MKAYPKTIKSVPQLIIGLQSKGMGVSDVSAAQAAIEKIGYYRLCGYSFQFFDASANRYRPGSNFDDVLRLYDFNCELSSLLFPMTSKIEVSLRAHFCESMLSLNDPLAYLDPSVFRDKQLFWQNLGVLCSEIARSNNEVFIEHNFAEHDGQIPIWAAVEVMSFGNLSKFISNLATGNGTPFSRLAKCYVFKTKKGKMATPSLEMMSSWIHTVVILRNMCAHNARIYNRSISKIPKILDTDRQNPPSRHCGLYHMMLSMKYLRSAKDEWNAFVRNFDMLLAKYSACVNLSSLRLPIDWKEHLILS